MSPKGDLMACFGRGGVCLGTPLHHSVLLLQVPVCGGCGAITYSRVPLVLFQEQWRDTRRWQLSVASELPELEEFPQEAGRGFSRFKNRQGDFKRNGWFKNGNRGL